MVGAPKFVEILKVLARHDVEFIVVGGVAAVLAGAPISTFDLDIMHRKSEANHKKLLAALDELDATYRDMQKREIKPDLEKLSSFRLHRLNTASGPLDLLTEIDPDLTFDDLQHETTAYDLEELTIRSLKLETIIHSKEHAGRDKDTAMLPLLRRTLDLQDD
ncbi:MAG: hypothetical protein GY906_05230 [bacterium]|nr:hypothetical protein [bacterium]